jgi:hypothetical protein
MAEENGLDELLRQMPVDQSGEVLIPGIHAALAAARRRASLIQAALRAGIASLSITAAVALVPRLMSLWELLPSEWLTSAAGWWSGLETAPVENLRSLALQIWSLPNTLAQSIGIELALGGVVMLFLSWTIFKMILTGQVSRKAVLQ